MRTFDTEVEDVETQGSTTTMTRHGLCARGIDFIERTQGGTVTTGFPIYDAHGNNVATLSRSGSSYAIGDRRSYDAWGVVRAQQSAGDPKLRYCASLGHKQDDESGLVYMRARYYEPTSGRFVSEDPARHGGNWLAYAANDPVNRIDQSGRWDYLQATAYSLAIIAQWNKYLGMSNLAVGEADRILSALNGLNDKVSTDALISVIKSDTLTAMNAGVINAMDNAGASQSIMSKAVGVIGVYTTGLEMAGWLLGLWGPGGADPDMLGD